MCASILQFKPPLFAFPNTGFCYFLPHTSRRHATPRDYVVTFSRNDIENTSSLKSFAQSNTHTIQTHFKLFCFRRFEEGGTRGRVKKKMRDFSPSFFSPPSFFFFVFFFTRKKKDPSSKQKTNIPFRQERDIQEKRRHVGPPFFSLAVPHWEQHFQNIASSRFFTAKKKKNVDTSVSEKPRLLQRKTFCANKFFIAHPIVAFETMRARKKMVRLIRPCHTSTLDIINLFIIICVLIFLFPASSVLSLNAFFPKHITEFVSL